MNAISINLHPTRPGRIRGSPPPGFTLIELLIVVTILAILASLLLPVFAKARERSRTINCAANLRQIGLALQMYGDDNDGFGPPVEGNNGTYVTDWPWLLSPYHKNMNLFLCPTRPEWRLDNETPSDSSDDVQDSAAYVINRYLVSPNPTDSGWMKQPLHESALESPSVTIAVLEAAGDDQRDAVQLDIEDTENQRHLGGINVLWCDGHVKFSLPEHLTAGYWTPWEGD